MASWLIQIASHSYLVHLVEYFLWSHHVRHSHEMTGISPPMRSRPFITLLHMLFVSPPPWDISLYCSVWINVSNMASSIRLAMRTVIDLPPGGFKPPNQESSQWRKTLFTLFLTTEYHLIMATKETSHINSPETRNRLTFITRFVLTKGTENVVRQWYVRTMSKQL